MAETGALETAFRRIALTRMADVPLCNPALAVEAVGFRDWQAHRVGVLITPWSINLVALPRHADSRALQPDERRSWVFPTGDYEFMGGEEPECGPFEFCSLYSPPDEFADQAQARATALAVMQQLFAAPPALTRRALIARVQSAAAEVPEGPGCTR
jgi:[NiFe] hydrogenase assembly HybE family chaperone